MNRKTAFWVVAGGLVLTLAFQNCVRSTSSSSQDSVSGNGAGYDGKTYVALAAAGQCPANAKVKSELFVRNSDRRAFITKDNCQPVSPPRDVTDELVPLPPHPISDSEILNGFTSQLGSFSETFDFTVSDTIDFTDFAYTVVRCGKTLSSSQSLTLAVIANLNTIGMSGFLGSAYYWNPGSTPEFQPIPANNNGLSMSQGLHLIFSSTNPSWSLDIDELTADPFNFEHMKATFTYSDGSNPVSVTGVDCYISP
jgi:hypothetical protein